MRANFLLFSILFFLFTSFVSSIIHYPKNFHQVDEKVYRSGQPNKKEILSIKKLQITTVLNLRKVINDKQEVKNTELVQVRVPMRAKKISYDDLLQSLIAIKNSKGKILVHCLHGSDRTGCIIASYRMVFQGWSKAKAIDEFQDEKYGYNSSLFPNILNLLKELDIDKLKRDLSKT